MGKLLDIEPGKCRAFAKVNLGLSVLGRRADGYHELSSVMAGVMLYDSICLKKTEAGLVVDCPKLSGLKQEENLVYKAASMYMNDVNVRQGFHITVKKRIPAGAGMGGGSSDAAVTLLLLRRFLSSSGQNAHIHRMATKLGADVPFFLGCDETPPLWEAALCTGIGEKITPLDMRRFWLVIAFLENGVSTPWAFSAWDQMNGFRPFRKADSCDDRRCTKVAGALETGDPIALSQVMYNDLEVAVLAKRPDIKEVKELLVYCGALSAAMTGTGSAVYGVCLGRRHAFKVKKRILEVVDEKTSGSPITHVEVIRTGVQG